MEALNGISVFVQVAEAGSFVGAGRVSGLSASAVGKSIARLEERLGVRLFHRSTRSVTLTAQGMRFLERSRRILTEIEAAEAEIQEASAYPSGPLRISLPVINTLFSPVFSAFMKVYPEIELELDFTDRLVDIIGEGFDAVIRTGKPSDSRLIARKLGRCHVMLVASPAYLERCGVPESLVNLKDHACLQYRYPNSGKLQNWPIHSEPGESELKLPATMICNSTETRVYFALQGHGLAYLPDFAVREALGSGKLQRVLEKEIDETEDFYLLWPDSKHPSPKIRALIDFLSKNTFSS